MTRALLAAAAFVIVVAGLRAAQPIVVPFLLSVFVAVLLAPPLFWLTRKGLPFGAALLVVVVAVVAFGGLLSALVGRSMNDFMTRLPEYEATLREEYADLRVWLEEQQVPLPDVKLLESLDPSSVMGLAGRVVGQLGALMANSLLILLATVFLLVEASSLPEKVRRAAGDADATLARMRQCAESVNRYMAIKAIVSLATGATIAGWLAIVGVRHAMLWGLLAALLNFIPNFGSVLAAIPAVLLAALHLGPGGAGLTALGFVVVNVVMGNVVEPRVMGRGLGLSTLVVFLSLVFWGWVLGPVGMLLSVPLTMTVKVALEANEESRPIAAFLG